MSLRVDDPDFKLYVGDARDQLENLEDGSVDCVVCSPPYFGLRDYGTGRWEGGDPGCEHAAAPARAVGNLPSTSSTLTTNNGRGPEPGDKYIGERHRYGERVPSGDCPICGAVWVDDQIGLERSPAEYVKALVEVFREVRRVLAPHGTVWINIGDSYAAERGYQVADSKHVDVGNTMGSSVPAGLKKKDRMMIPARLAIALQDDGWFLRSEIVWDKMSPMPESVTDRPTNSHEMIYMLTKRPSYFYDRVASLEPYTTVQPGRGRPDLSAHPTLDESLEPEAPRGADGRRATKIAAPPPGVHRHENYMNDIGRERWPHEGRNMRSVWRMATANMAEAHFAVFPEELVRKCLTAGCPELVCKVCGTPRRRVLVKGANGKVRNRVQGGLGKEAGRESHGLQAVEGTFQEGVFYESVGWSDCGCATGLAPDDYELIGTPTGELVDGNPTIETGRKGLNRERDEAGGTRPITRYEQRQYALQLAALSKGRRRKAEEQAGPEAFAHYLRTDDAGARPIPPELLEEWVGKCWLELVEVPAPQEGDYRPGLVLDPFMGAGTTALVARKMGLHAVGVELSEKYADMIAARLQQQSLFA